jgi:glucose 1-dehydrogenase
MCLTGGFVERRMNKELVLGNEVVFGAVNAACRRYDRAADALATADRPWLALITRRLAAPVWTAALKVARGQQDRGRHD